MTENGEAEDVVVSAADINKIDWLGDSPFFLVFTPAVDGPEGNIGIDIDMSGWIEINKEYFRSPGTWFMLTKGGRTVFAVVLDEGDKFWFTKRHVGNLMAGSEVTAYGIGKKQADDQIVNLWFLPNGIICGGDDVDILASRMLGA